MRDPGRIYPFLLRLGELWEKYPDLRFGQLLLNSMSDIWNVEEDQLLQAVETFITESAKFESKPVKKTKIPVKKFLVDSGSLADIFDRETVYRSINPEDRDFPF